MLLSYILSKFAKCLNNQLFQPMNPNFDKPYTFDRVVRIGISVIVLLVLFSLIKKISGALIPFMASWLIAYLINPFVNFIQHKLRFRSRVLSVFTALILLVAALVAAVYFLTTPITDEIGEMSRMIRTFAQSRQDLSFLPDSWEAFLREAASSKSVQEFFTVEKMTAWMREIWPRLWSFVSGSVSMILSFAVVFVMLLYIIFILLDFEKISKGWIRLVPDKYRSITAAVAEDVKFSMNKYYRNQALIAFIVGVLFTIGFNIIGLPMATVMGILIMFLNLIPYMQTFAIPPIILLTLLKSIQTDQSFGMGLLWFGLVFAIVQGFQDGYLVPRIMGKAMGLNPAVVLLSLTVWGTLLGVLGLIIALPFTSLITTYYRRFVLYENKEGESYSEHNPPPDDRHILNDDE